MLVTEEFFLNNEKHETTRKKFMEAALTASMRRSSHAIFSGYLVSFVVKKYHCHTVSPSFPSAVLFWRGDAEGLDFAIEGAGIDAEVRSGLAAVSAPAPQGLLNRRPFQAVKANHFIFSGFS